MRKKRIYSSTGLYHIVVRGVNKQNIFYENVDRNYFIALLRKYSKKLNVQIYAFCLMENHVHLELNDTKQKISLFMQCLCSMYARYFNRKYDRIGHLFQERYLSEVIKDEKYFVTVFRYILQNPEKAGVSKTKNYRWSSYNLYKSKSTIIDKRVIIKYFGSISNLYKMVDIPVKKYLLEIELRPSEKELNYVKRIKEILKADTPLLNPDIRHDELILKLRKLKAAKLSIRVISRITGISKYLVQRA